MNIQKYLDEITEERKPYFNKLRSIILKNIPKGFSEELNYNMIGYVVPHSIYPKGYHVKPETPLPFINLASQKGHIALYHMGLYSMPELKEWFLENYSKYSKFKVNMSKSCIRFKRMDDIPYELIAKLVRKVTVENWIEVYESQIKR